MAVSVIGPASAETSSNTSWRPLPRCREDCGPQHLLGAAYTVSPPVVATPLGTNYSVQHRIFGDTDGDGPEPERCFSIADPLLPGAPDDVVLFDGLPSALRTDFFGTVPIVTEASIVDVPGRFRLVIDTFTLNGEDLFPARFTDPTGQPFRDICFTIGESNPLDWAGVDNVLLALLQFRSQGEILTELNITEAVNPWTGFLNVVVPDHAGLGIDQVHLVLLVAKSGGPPVNDECEDAETISEGATAFSTVNATDSGSARICPEDGADHEFRADVWFNHTARCTGDLIIDLCDSLIDTNVAVYDECNACPPVADPIACNDDSDVCGLVGGQSFLVIPAAENDCFTFQIGGFNNDQGPGVLRIACTPGACCREGACVSGLSGAACVSTGGLWFRGSSCLSVACPAEPPEHDVCDNAIEIFNGVAFSDTTIGAGGIDETSTCRRNDNDSIDVWHKWTADCTGRATFGLCQSEFDTTLAVFDECGGTELACDGEGCAPQSQLQMAVEEGQTYIIRVAGEDGESGDYTVRVDGCLPPPQACCCEGPFCDPFNGCRPDEDPDACMSIGGTPLGPNTICGGDVNGNGTDDACEGCPEATIASAVPANGTVDARQPHTPDSVLPTKGIGDIEEPIIITLQPPVGFAEQCFALCETSIDVQGGPNDIVSSTDLGGGRYKVSLKRPITTNAVTTIEYTADGSWVEYTSHPANSNADAWSDAADVDDLIDCCLLGLCATAPDLHGCDMDRSGMIAPPDIIRAIDMLIGANAYIEWDQRPLPQNETCPPR